MKLILQIPVAFLLDILIGDPCWFPHPVKGIGRFIKILEKIFYKPYFNLRIGGVILALVVVGTSFAGGFLAIYFIGKINKLLEFILGSFIIFTCLSAGNLAREAKDVYFVLSESDIDLARKRVGRIVGRDTKNLSEPEVVRAAVESVAENSVDGIISPLFYAFLGGAPLALAYKAVNTLDSMLGYKNSRYFHFGWFSARLDDMANFIPARITALLIPLTTYIFGKDGKSVIRVILRDGGNSPSPNAGIPEAGFAGALGVRLGGTNFYQGKREDRPFIGDDLKKLSKEDILSAVKLMQALSIVTFLLFFGVWRVVSLLVGSVNLFAGSWMG